MSNKGRTIAVVVLLFLAGTFGSKLVNILDIVQDKINGVSKTVNDGAKTINTLPDRVNDLARTANTLKETVGNLDPTVQAKLNEIIGKLGQAPSAQTVEQIKSQLTIIEKMVPKQGPAGAQGPQGPPGQTGSSSSPPSSSSTTTTAKISTTTTTRASPTTTTTRPPTCTVRLLGTCI